MLPYKHQDSAKLNNNKYKKLLLRSITNKTCLWYNYSNIDLTSFAVASSRLEAEIQSTESFFWQLTEA
jgi:hypothetical protein